jgi:hypothetical protein
MYPLMVCSGVIKPGLTVGTRVVGAVVGAVIEAGADVGVDVGADVGVETGTGASEVPFGGRGSTCPLTEKGVARVRAIAVEIMIAPGH